MWHPHTDKIGVNAGVGFGFRSRRRRRCPPRWLSRRCVLLLTFPHLTCSTSSFILQVVYLTLLPSRLNNSIKMVCIRILPVLKTRHHVNR
jgi:hypothetical protein